MGNRDYQRDPEGRETTWQHDKRNRVESVTNGEQETTSYTYDLNGNRTGEEKPKGNSTTYVYDALNRLDEIHDYLGGITDYEYDGDNNLIAQVDAEQNRTKYEYDALNRRTAIEYPDTSRVEYTEYDGNGNLKVMTDANGVTVSYEYDALNRETERNYTRPQISSSADIQQIVSSYDANNNRLSTTERYYDGLRGDVVTRYTYDDFDRQLSKTDSFGRTLGYAYDDNGNRTRLTDPDQKHTVYAYDRLNRLHQAQAEGGTTTYTYDRASLIKRVSYPNNTETRYSYDGASRTESIEHTQNGGLVSRFEYAYDDNGNRTEQRETNGNGEETTSYGYDDLDRLETVTYPDQPAGSGHTVTYDYDGNYNRTNETAVNSTSGQTQKDRTYAYNERNQLTDITDHLDAANNVSYGYDASGNQISKTKAGATSDFIFDARDDLRQVMIGGSTVGQFLYDASGLRIEKQGERGTERYTYDGQSVLTQSDANNLTLAKYNYGPNRLLSLTHITEGTQFYLFDALGSVSNLTSANGTLQARYQYDAWGNKRNESGSSWNRFGFTGHEEDKETGLIYAKARFYDPDTGRFLSQDPWQGELTLAPSLHKYLYAYANPTVYIDPDGNKSVFGGATEQIGNFKDWLTEQNKEADSQLAAAAIGTAQFVATLGEGITRPLDIAANLAQVATGVDDQQVRDELAGTRQAISSAADFVVNGDYAQAAKNLHQAAVNETVKALEGDVTATANVTQALLSVATLKSASKGKLKTTKENSSGPGALVQAEIQSLQKIQGNVAKRQSLNERINRRGVVPNKVAPDVPAYEIPFNPLTKTQRASLKAKLESRSITKEEYQRLEWDRRFANRRATGVRKFWAEERARLRAGEAGTRNWAPEQRDAILAGKRPKYSGETIQGHHKYNALDHPQIANDPNNIYPATKAEHFERWHGGNWQNDTFGEPVNPLFLEEF